MEHRVYVHRIWQLQLVRNWRYYLNHLERTHEFGQEFATFGLWQLQILSGKQNGITHRIGFVTTMLIRILGLSILSSIDRIGCKFENLSHLNCEFGSGRYRSADWIRQNRVWGR